MRRAARGEAPAVPPGLRRRRLRVGYVSPDFRDHVVGRNLLPLLRSHDRSAVEVFCYASVRPARRVHRPLPAAADHWRDVAPLDDDAAADLVRADGIDVLVDLTLHMAGNRLGVFARRPAAVQVTFGGYPGTTGLAAIGYRLTDPYLDPPGTDADYAERSVRLPHSFWCYDADAMGVADVPDPGPPPAVANGFVTFGCLNNFCKVNDGVLAAWRRVLDAVPGSRLVLLAPPGSARDRARAALDGRVAFVPFQSRADYLATYAASTSAWTRSPTTATRPAWTACGWACRRSRSPAPPSSAGRGAASCRTWAWPSWPRPTWTGSWTWPRGWRPTCRGWRRSGRACGSGCGGRRSATRPGSRAASRRPTERW